MTIIALFRMRGDLDVSVIVDLTTSSIRRSRTLAESHINVVNSALSTFTVFHAFDTTAIAVFGHCASIFTLSDERATIAPKPSREMTAAMVSHRSFTPRTESEMEFEEAGDPASVRPCAFSAAGMEANNTRVAHVKCRTEAFMAIVVVPCEKDYFVDRVLIL